NTAPKIKLDATRALGAEIVLVGPASDDRIKKAEELEREQKLAPVPPYNDEKIIAGQGTIGLEILEDLSDPGVVLVPIGCGGLRSQSIGPINFEHIRKYVDDIITMKEHEIRQAMRHLLFYGRILAEPSGAVTTAAIMFHAAELPASDKIVAIVSGGNVEPQLF